MDLNHVGDTYRGFLVTARIPLDELQSTYTELVHTESGAEVIHIANNDEENLFVLSFQTLPSSSNGVAHILEHTVLCGSKKFPVKDPFFSMTRRSINTYMNALTGQDFTCYPASSLVPKDFYNLLDVYLDAVFHPKLDFLSFLQEGHRLAFAEIDNPASPFQIQGVVYNEMKGVYTNPESRLWSHLFKALTPDLPYAYDSGGTPKEIPLLTYQELLDFHRTFYHPSRCLFFFYGNLPIQGHLDFLLTNTLSTVKKEPFLMPLPSQPRFKSTRHVEASYPIAAHEPPQKQAIVALGILTLSCTQQQDLLALELIDNLLTDTDVSPLKQALLKSGLCTNVGSSLNQEMSEVPWVLVCKGCDEDSAPKILEIIKTTLEELCASGFDSESIDASLHQLEFDRTEISGGDTPFGLHLFFRTALAKQQGAEPSHTLLIHSLFKELRTRLSQNPNYLPSLLRDLLLQNPHSVLLTLKADPLLEKKEQEEENQILAQIRSALSEQETQTIFKQQKELLLFQEEQKNQSLDCLPKIRVHDLSPHAKDYPLSREGSVYHHDCFTNHILYADLHFTLPSLDFSQLRTLSLLASVITELGSGGRTYAEALEFQQAHIGELSSYLSLFIQEDHPERYKPCFSFRSKALERNIPPLFQILSDTARSPQFQDPARIKELLHQQATHLKTRLGKNALGYAIRLALSGFSPSSAIQQEWHGLPYYHYVMELIKKPYPVLCEELTNLYHSLIGVDPALVLSCAQKERDAAASRLPEFFHTLPHRTKNPWCLDFSPCAIPSQAKEIVSPVAYSVLAYLVPLRSAPLLIATQLLEHLVLHREIREQGGAYGSGASYSPSTGHFYFHSYRDPHIARTYFSFVKSIDHVTSKKFTEEQLEEAKLSVLQDLDAPLSPGQRASAAYAWLCSGRSYQKRDAFRKAILNASSEEISSSLAHALNNKEGVFISFAGKELLDRELKLLPFPIEKTPIL